MVFFIALYLSPDYEFREGDCLPDFCMANVVGPFDALTRYVGIMNHIQYFYIRIYYIFYRSINICNIYCIYIEILYIYVYK